MSYQRITIMGNIGKLEQRFLADGTSVVNFSVAVNDNYTKKDGTKVESVEWFNCVSFAKQSEAIAQYFQKGSQILVSGTMKTRKWEDNNGATRYSTDLKVSEFSFVDRKTDNATQPSQNQQHNPQNSQNNVQNAPQTMQNANNSQPAPKTQSQVVDNMAAGFEDDKNIPFIQHERFLL